MDISLAIAQGFHNAPRLYGDDTVRRPVRISGFHSGLRAGRDEFFYGVYDGVTGLWTQPFHQAKKGGAIGFVKGIGMGIGGFVLKDIAAFIGPFGYTLKGIHKELQKSSQPTHFIRKARIVQGQKDLKHLTPNERADAERRVERGWRIVHEVLTAIKQKKELGPIKGRLALMRAKKEWTDTGAAESVNTAERALQARREGKSLEEALRDQKQVVRKANESRAPAMEEHDEVAVPELENGRMLSGAGTAGQLAELQEKRPKMNGAGNERSETETRDFANGYAT